MPSHLCNFKVRISDADQNGTLKLPALLQLLQESATEHAHILGVDFKKLSPMNLSWALSKLVLEIDTLPKWGERIYIETWPSARDRIVTYREFTANAHDGRPLFRARSQWLVFDTRKRRISRLDALPEWETNGSRLALDIDLSAPIQKPEFINSQIQTCARTDDIDLNGHVNNSIYLVWALDSLPSDFPYYLTPRTVRINFLEEVMPRNIVDITCSCQNGRSIHSVIKKNDARECARLSIDWRNPLD